MTYQRRQPPNLLKQQLKLSSLIIPEYYAAHTAIWSGEYNEYLGDGGRGSLKSTFAATEVVLLVMRVPNIHAVVLRKVGNTLATSVWPEYNRVIDRMGIRHLWKQTKKPYTLTYIPTGQTIQFYGLDDPGKLFLSTPSARRATWPCWRSVAARPISIHALREEGDAWASRI